MSTYSDTVFDSSISEARLGFIDKRSLSHGMLHSLKAHNVLDLFSCWNLTICHFVLLDFIIFFFNFATDSDDVASPSGCVFLRTEPVIFPNIMKCHQTITQGFILKNKDGKVKLLQWDVRSSSLKVICEFVEMNFFLILSALYYIYLIVKFTLLCILLSFMVGQLVGQSFLLQIVAGVSPDM